MTGLAAAPRLIPVVSGVDGPRCLILPGAGAGFVPYARLAAGLGEELGVGVDFVRALGLLPGESPERSITQMAASVLDLLATAPVPPRSVFGWSLGGLVGWEVCVALAERGHLPDLVIVDSAPRPEPPEPGEQERVRTRIISELGPHATAATIDAVVGTLAAQSAAFAAYRAGRGYPGRVLLLSCAPHHTPARVTARRQWRELAPRLRVGQLDAGHHEVFEPVHLPQLVAAVGAFLRSADEQEQHQPIHPPPISPGRGGDRHDHQ